MLVIQNDPRVPAGGYGELLRQRGRRVTTVRLFAGEPLPAAADKPVLVLGGYMGVHDEADYPFLGPLKAFLRHAAVEDIPVLGICLGGQLLSEVLGGRVISGSRGEKGLCRLDLTPQGVVDPLFAGLPAQFTAFEWHNDSFEPPPGATLLATSADCPGQAFRWHNAWGVQFHPEVDQQIVAAWSGPVDAAGHYLTEFRAGASEHRAMARRLLENFLALADSSPPSP